MIKVSTLMNLKEKKASHELCTHHEMEAPERVPEDNVVLNDVLVRGEGCRIKLAAQAVASAVRRHGSRRRVEEKGGEKQRSLGDETGAKFFSLLFSDNNEMIVKERERDGVIWGLSMKGIVIKEEKTQMRGN